ncbi:TlpA family protein disulfide reductase [Natrialbaceae archaeon A-gly3]
MRRRDVLAGLGSLGVVGAGGVLAVRGVPSLGEEQETYDPVELETLETVGSEAGEITVPAEGQVMLVDFFATWCDICEDQMPTLAEARDRIDEDVPFVSVTFESPAPDDDDRVSIVSDWEDDFVAWNEDDGYDWSLALDPSLDLASQYNAQSVPTTVAIDGEGVPHWRSTGRKEVEEIVDGVETALEAQ